jgi:hypothetical protein
MFDVPPPLLSRGIEAYGRTWEHHSIPAVEKSTRAAAAGAANAMQDLQVE